MMAMRNTVPLAERRGTTTLELALIAPVLIATMVALAECSYAMTVDGLLNHAAEINIGPSHTDWLASGSYKGSVGC
ncbi:TadE family protein [Azospirillum sp. Sh1]|uniref:TadE family protein n=1 Tax=Azospirillum sp. Sh1 TaxID=2607285 RepID=UPI0011EDB4FD|nr:TadE family protein [Azospirillum sp. Sh1]KAA0571177.1 pilus assembly protein [Azospirillum sp. Sh1]